METVERTDGVDLRGRPRVQTSFVGEESQTVQSDRAATDIQTILRQFGQTGIVESLNQAEAMFADISEFTDFADAMRHAREAEAQFMELSSKVREIFHHDVAEWLDTAHDEDKRDALIRAGIIEGDAGDRRAAVASLGTASADDIKRVERSMQLEDGGGDKDQLSAVGATEG